MIAFAMCSGFLDGTIVVTDSIVAWSSKKILPLQRFTSTVKHSLNVLANGKPTMCFRGAF